jgi:hypothetical protein
MTTTATGAPVPARCDTCGVRDHNVVGSAACALLATLKADLLEHAHTLTPEPTIAQVLDLWAHARYLADDGMQAARWVRKVLDLGWRPHLDAPAPVGGPSAATCANCDATEDLEESHAGRLLCPVCMTDEDVPA